MARRRPGRIGTQKWPGRGRAPRCRTILTHSAQVASMLGSCSAHQDVLNGHGRRRRHAGCPTTTGSAPPVSLTPSARRRERGPPVVRDLPEGRLNKYMDLLDPQQRSNSARVLRPTSHGAWRGTRQCSETTPGFFALAPSLRRSGMNVRSRHLIGCDEVVGRHEGEFCSSGDIGAPVGARLRSVGLTAAV